MLFLLATSRQLGGSCEDKWTTIEMEPVSCLPRKYSLSSHRNLSLCVVISVDCFYYFGFF